MDHIAIDLGGKESQVCVRTGDGVIVEERPVRDKLLGAVSAVWLPTDPHLHATARTRDER